ncbi:hypothetical protein DYB30_013845 [Aphanomyces astaci]|uniref:ERAP1-like C-terminal domain-containing protein n=1 Tax=Aphanomyces astaci TaxID=112090 RepID=A0A397EAM7_APHAT|nr:hypothetical protein DYB34_010105 [Aphanomyces astaci]RHY78335.1 hypothetical protein DYB30_013845 [Aphanomyces astaci]
MDQELTSNFRRDVIAMLAAANDMAVAAQASARFHTAVAAPASLSADLRSIVYSIHVRTTSEPDAAFEHPPPVFETSVFIEEKLHVLGALGRFPSVELKTRALEWAAWRERTILADRRGVYPVCVHRQLPVEQAAAAVEAFLVGHPQGAFAPPLALFLENIRTVATMYARDVTPLAAWIQTL